MMSSTSASEMISFLKTEKENLEQVNSNLIRVLEKKEIEIVSLHQILISIERTTHRFRSRRTRIRGKEQVD